jgi:hypothetical protein
MLKRVLEQMQFEVEGTGGGCEVMSLYVNGHAIVVSIDAHTDFSLVGPDREISVGIYHTVNRYGWLSENQVNGTHVYTQSEAINVVVDALDYVSEQEKVYHEKYVNTLACLWHHLEKRHGLGISSADEVDMSMIDEEYRPEIEAFRTLWESMLGGAK